MPINRQTDKVLDSKSLHHITDLLQRNVESGKTAGCAVAVSRGGKSEFTEYFGYADLENKEPIREDTIYRIYSMSKPVAVVAALMLYERGLFALDDPIAKYIPEFAEQKVVTLDEAGKKHYETPRNPLTIRNLFTMTSGLAWMEDPGPAAEEMGVLMKGPLVEGKGTLEVAKLVAQHVSLDFHPGEKWLYGYSHDILGALVCVLTGKTFGGFLKDEIFGPLGMSDTDFWVPPEKADRLAKIYRLDDNFKLTEAEGFTDSFLKPKLLESGGGGMVSTLGDYLKFSKMLLSGMAPNGTRILGRKTIELMATDQLTAEQRPYFTRGWQGYGYGLGVRTMVNLGMGGHNGSIGEFGWSGMAGTWFCIDPVEEMAAVYMTQLIPGKFDAVATLLPALYSAIE